MPKILNRALKIGGEVSKVGTPYVTVLEYDASDNVISATGATVPTDGDTGYAKGCRFIKTGGSTGTTIYFNEGSATSADFNATVMPLSGTTVAAGSTLTLTEATHNGKTILLDTAAGSTVTLPAASGSGAVYKFIVSVLATSNSHIIKVANSSDAMQGFVFSMSDDPATVKGFFAVAGTSDTITLNRSTTGSVTKGEYIEVVDLATNVFQVRGWTSSTGTEATPFSATV